MFGEFKNSATLIAMAALSSCTENPLKCAEKYSNNFEGVAFLIGTEQLVFESSDDCSVLVAIPQNEAQRVYNAGASSNFEGPVRPVYLSVRGRLKLDRDDKGWVRIFVAEAVDKIDLSVSKKDVQIAFTVAFGSPNPNQPDSDVSTLSE